MDRRDAEGRFSQEYADKEFISAVQEVEVASTRNVAEEVGCSYNLAYQRLKRLEEEGDMEVEEVGPSFVWFLDE